MIKGILNLICLIGVGVGAFVILPWIMAAGPAQTAIDGWVTPSPAFMLRAAAGLIYMLVIGGVLALTNGVIVEKMPDN
jgi:hypothetical protein